MGISNFFTKATLSSLFLSVALAACGGNEDPFATVCGDGVLDFNEGCDDGNTVGGDGCNSDCEEEVCGNAVLDTGEECDDGNTENGDVCNADCTVSTCDNGLIEPGEVCYETSTIDFIQGAESAVLGKINSGDDLDMVVLSRVGIGEDKINVLRGDGEGFVVDAVINLGFSTIPKSPVLADVTGDGKNDLVLANAVSDRDSVSIFPNDGFGKFGAELELGLGSEFIADLPSLVLVGDLDTPDGDNDIVAIGSGSSQLVSIFRNDGGGNFSAPLEFSLEGRLIDAKLAFADDNDLLDLVVISNNAGDSIIQYFLDIDFDRADGKPFTSTQGLDFTGQSLRGLAIIPGNQPGDLAGVASLNTQQDNLRFVEMDGPSVTDGIFRIVEFDGAGPSDLVAVDMDQDQVQDIAVVDGDGFVVLRNQNQNGAFDAFRLPIPFVFGNELITDDINKDGTPDFVIDANLVLLSKP